MKQKPQKCKFSVITQQSTKLCRWNWI